VVRQVVPGAGSGDRKSSVADSRQPCTADRQWCGQRRSWAGSDPEIHRLEEFVGQIRQRRPITVWISIKSIMKFVKRN